MAATNMAGFDDLPPELTDDIFERTLPLDKPTVTSKQIRQSMADRKKKLPPSRVTSILTLAFASKTLRPRYRRFLENFLARYAKVIKVNIVDYDFRNFMLYLQTMTDPNKGYGGEIFKRFHLSIGGTDDINDRDLDGPYFAVNIIYTRSFDNDEDKLRKWLSRSDAIEKKSGHLRVFYRVTEAVATAALAQMQRGQTFNVSEYQGQLIFLKQAIKTKFIPPLEANFAAAVYQAVDINRGRIVEDYAGFAEAVANRAQDDEESADGEMEDVQLAGQQQAASSAAQTLQVHNAAMPAPPPPTFATLGGLPSYVAPAQVIAAPPPFTMPPVPQPTFAPPALATGPSPHTDLDPPMLAQFYQAQAPGFGVSEDTLYRGTMKTEPDEDEW